jgi:hypothetical protein
MFVALEHRDGERGEQAYVARNVVVFGISLNVGYLNRPLFETSADTLAARANLIR